MCMYICSCSCSCCYSYCCMCLLLLQVPRFPNRLPPVFALFSASARRAKGSPQGADFAYSSRPFTRARKFQSPPLRTSPSLMAYKYFNDAPCTKSQNAGLISADRSYKGYSPAYNTPFPFKSSASDSSPLPLVYSGLQPPYAPRC